MAFPEQSQPGPPVRARLAALVGKATAVFVPPLPSVVQEQNSSVAAAGAVSAVSPMGFRRGAITRRLINNKTAPRQ